MNENAIKLAPQDLTNNAMSLTPLQSRLLGACIILFCLMIILSIISIVLNLKSIVIKNNTRELCVTLFWT